MEYLIAFVTGGLICAVSQLVLDQFKLTPAHVLVGLVVIGAALSGLGVYQRFADFAGAGALVPVSGFGSSITIGVLRDLDKLGWEGLFTGVFKITSLGLSAAVFFGTLSAFFVKPKH